MVHVARLSCVSSSFMDLTGLWVMCTFKIRRLSRIVRPANLFPTFRSLKMYFYVCGGELESNFFLSVLYSFFISSPSSNGRNTTSQLVRSRPFFATKCQEPTGRGNLTRHDACFHLTLTLFFSFDRNSTI
jgi:hypothetical protein